MTIYRKPRRREVFAEQDTVINVKLLDSRDRIRLTIIKASGHYAFADISMDGMDRLAELLDDHAEIIERTLTQRGELNTDGPEPSYEA